jgi:adenosylcobinamide kinase/adenosylcobinamide-phosphate guanylyltransferase
VLVLGGARSGKSAFAEKLLADEPEVFYAATAPLYEGDAEWSERVARHRDARPARWRTIEVGDAPNRLADLLRTADHAVLVDSLTLWLTAAMDGVGAWNDGAWRGGQPRDALDTLVTDLVDAYLASVSSAIVVSDEVGFGMVPEAAGSRRFRDALGELNQSFASAADEVYFVVSGFPLVLKQGPQSSPAHGS